MELGGAAQGLAGADAAGALLGVVDDDHGDAVAALQFAQKGEQWRHLAAGVLINAMQAHEGIEDEQARLYSYSTQACVASFRNANVKSGTSSSMAMSRPSTGPQNASCLAFW